jgi:tetratricopeptide (TPR) repeat protein
VLSHYPENNGALLVSGIAYARSNKLEQATVPLEKFVKLRKGQPMAKTDTTLETAYYFLGETYMKLKRPQDAINALEAALAITPTDADALYQVGLAYQSVGQPEKALERYQQATRLVPDFTEAYTGMIESYTTLGKPDYVAFARGMQAFSLKDYKTAQTHLVFATKALPNFSPAFLGLGLTYEKTDRLDLALDAVNRALLLNPGDFAAEQARGRIEAAKKSKGG